MGGSCFVLRHVLIWCHVLGLLINFYSFTTISTPLQVGDIVSAPRFRSMANASFTSTAYGVRAVDDFINLIMQDNGVPRTKILPYIESQYDGFMDSFFEKQVFKRINLHPAVIVGPVSDKPGFYKVSP